MFKKANSAGTYDFAIRENKSDELGRLQKQAGLDIASERTMWRQAGLKNGMNVLDIGCGPGIVAASLAKEIPDGHVTGVDLSSELLANALETSENNDISNVSFAVGDVYELDFSPSTFDFVYARFLFQHLHDPEKGLQNIFRVLKPGGRVCLLDVDDRFLLLSPEPKNFRKFHSAAVEAQSVEGGNREVGGALFGLLKETGFDQVDLLVHVLRSMDCGLKNFLDIAIRFKAGRLSKHPNLIGQADLETALSEIAQFETKQGAWGALGLFTALGTKP